MLPDVNKNILGVPMKVEIWGVLLDYCEYVHDFISFDKANITLWTIYLHKCFNLQHLLQKTLP